MNKRYFLRKLINLIQFLKILYMYIDLFYIIVEILFLVVLIEF